MLLSLDNPVIGHFRFLVLISATQSPLIKHQLEHMEECSDKIWTKSSLFLRPLICKASMFFFVYFLHCVPIEGPLHQGGLSTCNFHLFTFFEWFFKILPNIRNSCKTEFFKRNLRLRKFNLSIFKICIENRQIRPYRSRIVRFGGLELFNFMIWSLFQ